MVKQPVVVSVELLHYEYEYYSSQEWSCMNENIGTIVRTLMLFHPLLLYFYRCDLYLCPVWQTLCIDINMLWDLCWLVLWNTKRSRYC